MIKKSHLLSLAALVAATTFHSAHKDTGGSHSKAAEKKEKEAKEKEEAEESKGPSDNPTPNLADNPGDPNAVQGGPKKEAEQTDEQRQEEIAGPTVEPEQTRGTPCFDRSSQRETEVFDSGDVVFIREGSTPALTAYPKHEAKTRFTKINDRQSAFRQSDGHTITKLELENGETVAIEGTKVTITKPEGMPDTDGPSLNVHGPAGVNV